MSWKYCGHSVSTWSPLQSCHNCLWYQKPEKPNQSHRIICLLLGHTEPFTLLIGSIDTTQKVSLHIEHYWQEFGMGAKVKFLSSERKPNFSHNSLIVEYYSKIFFRLLRYHRHCCWSCTNYSLLRLLLSLHYESPKRKETSASCLKDIKKLLCPV